MIQDPVRSGLYRRPVTLALALFVALGLVFAWPGAQTQALCLTRGSMSRGAEDYPAVAPRRGRGARRRGTPP